MKSGKNPIKFIFKVLAEFWLCIIAWILIGIFWAFTTNAFPYLIKLMVDTAINSSRQEIILKLYPLVVKFLSIQFILVLLYRVQDGIIIYFPPKLKKNISIILLDQMFLHGQSILHSNFSGGIANKISDVISGIPEITKIFIEKIFASFIMLSMVLVTLYRVNINFLIAMVLWITVFLSMSLFIVFKKRHLSMEAASARAVVTGNVVDVLSNLSTVKNFSANKHEIEYHKNIVDVHVAKDRARDLFFLILHSFQGLTFFAFQGLCFYLLLSGMKKGILTPGDFILVLSLNRDIVTNFWSMARDMREVWDRFGMVSHALEIIFSPLETTDAPDAKELVVKSGQIVFDHVKFCYKNTDPIFENKTIIIASGQKVGIVGYSGSGKTTFANLILRAYNIDSGAIFIDEQNIKDVTQKSIRNNISVISQNPILFNRTIAQNISYANPNATKEEIIQAAIKANAHEFILGLPGQYDFKVGEHGSKLSGGQRQRIAIAQAFLKNAPILIFDEATSQLDAITEACISKSLMTLAAGRTTLIISHRLITLKNTDRILVFHQGKIIQDGRHEDLIKEPGLYQSLWQTQMDK